MKIIPKTVEGLASEHFLGAFILYTMEKPFAFYKLITKAFNVSGLRSKDTFCYQLPYLKLITVGLEVIPKNCIYWCFKVVYRGVSVENNPELRAKYDDYMNAFAPGTKLTFTAPTSTTTDSRVASQFTFGIQYVFLGEKSNCGPGGLLLAVSFFLKLRIDLPQI
jgi:hypothetical protein